MRIAQHQSKAPFGSRKFCLPRCAGVAPTHVSKSEFRNGGQIHLSWAMDFGDALNFGRCRTLLRDVDNLNAHETPRAPKNFGFSPAPLRLSRRGPQLRLPVHGRDLVETPTSLDISLYDFGGATFTLRYDWQGGLEELLGISITLETLERDLIKDPGVWVGREAQDIFDLIRPALRSPELIEQKDSFRFFQMNPPADFQANMKSWSRKYELQIAKILEATEDDHLSGQQIKQSLDTRISFGCDLTVVGDDVCLIVDDDFSDTRAILDYAFCKYWELNLLLEKLRSINEVGFKPLRLPRYAHVFQPLLPYVEAFLPFFTYRRMHHLRRDIRSELTSVLDAVNIRGSGYAARLLDRASQRLGVSYLVSQVGQELRELEEQIAHERGEALERVVMYLVAIEVLRSFVGH